LTHVKVTKITKCYLTQGAGLNLIFNSCPTYQVILLTAYLPMNLESNQFQMNFYFYVLYFAFNYLVQSIIVKLKKKSSFKFRKHIVNR